MNCACDTHCQQCSGCGPVNDQGWCAGCLTPKYRWIPTCSECHAELPSFTATCACKEQQKGAAA